jgi:alpha-amylase
LKTSDDSVRDKIASYLSALVDLGVSGFRVDAGKHMYPADLDAILQRVNQHAGSKRLPFFFFEVTGTGNEAISGKDYLAVGASSGQAVAVTEFKYASLFDQFASTPKISTLKSLLTTTADYLPSAQAVVFTTNHDTERANAVYYQDAEAYDLATVFLLTWPYGYPSLMSSFAFDRHTSAGLALGPPSDAMGHTNSIYAPGSTTPSCAADPHSPPAGSWVCQHRDPFVRRLLAFRRALAAQTAVMNFWDDGDNQIAYGLGDQGFVVINRSDTALAQTLTTGLPPGSYCDIYKGEMTGASCTGVAIEVGANGKASFTAPSMGAVVLYSGAKL